MNSNNFTGDVRSRGIPIQAKNSKVSTTERLMRISKRKVKSAENALKNQRKYGHNLDDDFDSNLQNFQNPFKYFKQNYIGKEMDLSNCNVGPVLMDDISQKFFPSMTVTRLLLGNCRLGNEGARVVVRGLMGNLTVEELDLSDNGITVNVMTTIGEFLQSNMTLEKLSLAGNCLTDETVEPLLDHLHSKCLLKELDLSRNILTEEFGKVSAMLAANKNLETLKLSSNQLADKGVAAMVTGIQKSKHLKYLDISWNYLYDAGAKEVAEIIRLNKSLSTLLVCGNFIREEGASHVGDALKKNTILQKLCIGHNFIKSEGAHVLLKAITQSVNSSLKELDLNGTVVDASFVNSLKTELPEKLPYLKVLRYTQSHA